LGRAVAEILELLTQEMMIKDSFYETVEKTKKEYKRIKRKKVKVLSVWLLITAILLGWFFYVQSVKENQRSIESRIENQLKELENKFENKFKNLEKKNQEQDSRIENAKTRKREVFSVLQQPTRSLSSQRSFSRGGCEQYRPLMERYTWDVNIALAVCNAESGGNPNAVSKTNDYGLMQLHSIPLYDPEENIKYAYYEKYLKGGWVHWSVCKNGRVKCF